MLLNKETKDLIYFIVEMYNSRAELLCIEHCNSLIRKFFTREHLF